jgi:hypothetical protein
MKSLSVFLVMIILFSCSQENQKGGTSSISNLDNIQKEIERIRDKYKPGLGEIMTMVQIHHAKLWFAGSNNNWPLADYERGELNELFHYAEDIETERPEIKTLPIIYPALDSLDAAIKRKESRGFLNSFRLLTKTCNTCHTDNNFAFNVIIIPTAPFFTNQDFRIHK